MNGISVRVVAEDTDSTNRRVAALASLFRLLEDESMRHFYGDIRLVFVDGLIQIVEKKQTLKLI